MKYRIYMAAQGDHEEGWCCASGERSNAPMHRTDEKRDADVYDDENAVKVAADYRDYGYKCEVRPRISAKRRLEILERG